ncbi:hydrolase [Jeotgalibacillus sp. R-1-5s-1]|uniref:hydrolase n=1 Tax=Jeotgalibacillus sp. R-1-5s-1 TaxID=2555897 RepID=UPI00106B1988|nr:hydrolase [Jeotgalibacillus sp. R-1-5s-1]TFD94407.1 hydrolase [Jeotgalibacillus sp. R-1-5s-1]
MGSRVMHIIIANQIAEAIRIEDRSAFLLGGIAADAASSKELSHFYRGDLKDYSRNIAYDEFLKKYAMKKDDPFIQGYYTHLIADDLWLKGFYLPWLRNRMEKDEEVFQRYHHDFRLLNSKLLEHYDASAEITCYLKKSFSMIETEEVTKKDLLNFIPYMLEDMEINKQDIELDLSVFTFEQIIGYIETSVEKGIMCLQCLR